jgi:branched-subunit amino acid transport protein
MDQDRVLLTILGMALVTYLPRLLPAWILAKRELPPLVRAWLRNVPVAVLAALTLPALLVRDQRVDLSPGNLYLWAAVPTLLVAWRTRSMFGAVAVGMVIVAAARYFL